MAFLDQFRKYKFTDTRVGTDSVYPYSTGNTLPYTGVPFGMNYFAVQTSKTSGSWWFNPNKTTFEGFRLTHQPSPWMGDFSSLTILPARENIDSREYNPKDSTFIQHYNQILFVDGEKTELTASKDSGIIKYDVENPSFVLEAKKFHLEEKNGQIEGYVKNFSGSEDENFTMHIVISSENISLEKLEDAPIIVNDNIEGTFNRFFIKTGKELYISTSFISIEQARLNHEKMTKDFEKMLLESAEKWEFYLNKFDIENVHPESHYDRFDPYDRVSQEKFFYQAVYRSFLFPMTFYEIDENGKEVHYDTISKTVKEGKYFTNFGLWDLNKSLFPLYAMVDREIFGDMLEGFLNQYRNSGYLPKWLSPDERGLMPGTLIDNVIAEASSKGIRDDLMEELLEAMMKSAEVDSGNRNYGRAAVNEYRQYGYVPSDFHEAVNQTLDNCLSDYSISVVAQNLGKEDIAKKYFDLSKNYANIFDKETGFMWHKDRKGNFEPGFNPLHWGSPYTEGSAYQNSFNVYHDYPGLIELFGSKEKFAEKLDELANAKADFTHGAYGFEIHEMTEFASANFGQIGISNQPSFHLPYLFNYVDQPKKTQLILKELYLNYFKYDFKGYPGDEDNGSMSSWYILSTLGLYPVCPGDNVYQIGMPFWNKATVELYNGKKLNITVNENYHQKKFIKEMKVNGEIYDKTSITWDMLENGCDIEFTLGLV